MTTSPGIALRAPSVMISVHDTTAGSARVDVAGDDGLQRQHDLGGDDDRVDDHLRLRGVPAAAGDADLEVVLAGHDAAGTRVQMAGGGARAGCAARTWRRREPLEQAVGDHRLARRARAPRPAGRRGVPCRRTRPRRPAPWPAPSTIAMCPSWPQACIAPVVPGRYGRSPRSLQRQPVHVGAQPDGCGQPCRAHGPRRPRRCRRPRGPAEPELGQDLGDVVAGADLPKPGSGRWCRSCRQAREAFREVVHPLRLRMRHPLCKGRRGMPSC